MSILRDFSISFMASKRLFPKKTFHDLRQLKIMMNYHMSWIRLIMNHPELDRIVYLVHLSAIVYYKCQARC